MPHRFFTQQEILVELTTAAKSRIYFEPKKLWITLEAGSIEKLVYNKSSGKLKLSLGKKSVNTPEAYLRSSKNLMLDFKKRNGAYIIPLSNQETQVSF